MITEVLLLVLTLSFYVILFIIWCQLRPLMKMMTDVENISKYYGFFVDIIDTTKRVSE